jgi:hypothetical protein
MENELDKFSLDKIDPSIQNLIKNLKPLSDSYTHSTDFPLKNKTQTKDKNNIQNMSQFKKGSFSVLEKEKINDTICEYALSHDLSTEQIKSYLKTNNIEKKSSIFNLDLEDKDSLLYHLSEAVPSRSINSILKYTLNRYCHLDNDKNGNNKTKNVSNFEGENKNPMYTSNNLDIKEKKEDKMSSDFSLFIEDKKSPLIIQMALLQAIQYFLDKFLQDSIKGYKLVKNNYEFVPKNNLNEKDYKIDLEEGKIIISEELKESKDHKINIFYIKNSFDLGTLFKIHYDKIQMNWEEIKKLYEKSLPEEDKDLYNLSEKEIEEEWKKILKEYKVEEVCSIRQDKKMIKEYLIIFKYKNLL